jgi:hypothetical protein
MHAPEGERDRETSRATRCGLLAFVLRLVERDPETKASAPHDVAVQTQSVFR